MNTPYTNTGMILPQMKGKPTYRNEKSLRLPYSSVMTFPFRSILFFRFSSWNNYFQILTERYRESYVTDPLHISEINVCFDHAKVMKTNWVLFRIIEKLQKKTKWSFSDKTVAFL